MNLVKDLNKLDSALIEDNKAFNYQGLLYAFRDKEKLTENYVKQLGYDFNDQKDCKNAVYSLLEINSASENIPGFIRFQQTSEFFDKNASALINKFFGMAEYQKQSFTEFLQNTKYLSNVDIAEDFLLNNGAQIKSALVWNGLEDLAYNIQEIVYEQINLNDINKLSNAFVINLNTQQSQTR